MLELLGAFGYDFLERRARAFKNRREAVLDFMRFYESRATV